MEDDHVDLLSSVFPFPFLSFRIVVNPSSKHQTENTYVTVSAVVSGEYSRPSERRDCKIAAALHDQESYDKLLHRIATSNLASFAFVRKNKKNNPKTSETVATLALASLAPAHLESRGFPRKLRRGFVLGASSRGFPPNFATITAI